MSFKSNQAKFLLSVVVVVVVIFAPGLTFAASLRAPLPPNEPDNCARYQATVSEMMQEANGGHDSISAQNSATSKQLTAREWAVELLKQNSEQLPFDEQLVDCLEAAINSVRVKEVAGQDDDDDDDEIHLTGDGTGNTNCMNCSDCVNCTNCSNCSNCNNCTNCVHCSNNMSCTACMNCSNCTNCTGCVNCSNCTNCTNLTNKSNCNGCTGH